MSRFDTLSGSLTTTVPRERYWRSRAGGTPRFLVNRALRIYPPYLAVLVPPSHGRPGALGRPPARTHPGAIPALAVPLACLLARGIHRAAATPVAFSVARSRKPSTYPIPLRIEAHDGTLTWLRTSRPSMRRCR